MHMSSEHEHRMQRRHRVLKDGKIVSSDMNSLIDVKIRDMSASGALVNLPTNVVMPDKFNFLVVSERLLYPAAVRWRKGEAMGIEFTGEPRLSVLRTDKPR